MTQEIINLLEEKRNSEDTNSQKYTQLKKKNNKQDHFNPHEKLKALTENTRNRISVVTRNIEEEIQLTEGDKKILGKATSNTYLQQNEMI